MSFGIPFSQAHSSPSLVAVGGTITYVNGYKIHTFTSSGTFQVLSGSAKVEYLVVGGGGGAGGSAGDGWNAGGGGAGGYTSAGYNKATYNGGSGIVIIRYRIS